MQELFEEHKDKIAVGALDSVPVGIVWISQNGYILEANEKFCNEREYTIEEIKKLHIRDINPLISTKGWRKYWNQVDEAKTNVVQSEHMTKSGIVFPIETTSNMIETENGFKVMFSIVTSILERDKFRDLLEVTSHNAKVVGWEWNRVDGEFTYTSYLQELCGGEEGDCFESLLSQILSKTQMGEFRALMEKCTNEQEEIDHTFTFNDKQDIEQWIEVEGQPVVIDDEVVKIQGTIQNITNHRMFSDEMHILKYCMDHSEDQIFWSDDEGRLSYVNIKACEALGYSKKELIGMYVWDVVKISEEHWFQHWESLKNVGEMVDNYLQKRKNGRLQPVMTKKTALKYKDKYYNLAMVRDMSETVAREAQLQASLDKINELQARLSLENTYLKEEISKEHRFSNIISKSDDYKKVLAQVQDVAATGATVLILGESGTGKELLANAVHELSDRSDKPLIKINCATLPENLIESELFGHEKGAFTGAYERKIGRFELADGGTIFLDEMGELPLGLQAKLLRVLQEGEFQRLGNARTMKVDTRIIAATNRDLIEQVKKGAFREDLYFRLNVFPIINIPLRERKDDIPLLAQHFMEKFSDKMNKQLEGISPASIRRLTAYDYPGNVRELENIIERAVITNKGKILKLPSSFFENHLKDDEEDKGLVTMEEMQRDYIIRVLEHTNWKITGDGGAAAILGMNGKTLYSRMTKLDIQKP